MLQTRVDFSGDFFERDPSKTVRSNIGDMLDALAEEGEADAQGQIAAAQGSMPFYTGHTLASIVGRRSSNSGKRWGLNVVISANTSGDGASDAIRTKAAASSIERRFHPFRRTNTSLRNARAVLAANLTRNVE